MKPSLKGLAVLGVGRWGQNLLRTFCKLLGEERVMACDLSQKRLQAVARQYPHVHTTTDFESVLRDPRVEAVAIATPAVTHAELAREALRSGKHTWVEKPLALSVREAERLIEQAEGAERVLMVDHLLEYHPAVEALRGLIQDGALGEVYYVHSQRLNFGVVRTEENALWSLAPHDISVILYLLEEEPQRVRAEGAVYLQEGIEDVVLLTLEFSRSLSHVHVGWLYPQKMRRLVVVGSEGMAVFDDVAPTKLVVHGKRALSPRKEEGKEKERKRRGVHLEDRGSRSVALDEKEPLQAAAEHFLRCIERGEQPRSDGRDGLRVLRVLEAAQRSLKEVPTP